MSREGARALPASSNAAALAPPGAAREHALHARVARRARRDGLLRGAGIAVGRALLFAAILGFWAYFADTLLDRQSLSDPVAVFVALLGLVRSGRLWPDLWQTVFEVVTGYAAGALIGITLAFLFALAPSSRRILNPFIVAFYAIPKVALAPLIVMWFGLGTAPKVILAAAFVFFIVFMNAAAGIDGVNPHHVYILRVMGAKRPAILRKLVLPTTIPFLMVGLRLALPEALIGAVIGEFIAADRGLGYLVNTASAQLNAAVSLAAILVLLMVVAVGDFLLALVERRLLRWRPQRTSLIGV